MNYRPLGNSDLKVSVIGLGSMTWGHQNSEADAHRQLDYALSRGVNLVDAAEMYPTPSRADTWGDTERFIGTWLSRSKRRQDIVLTSKIVGPPRQSGHMQHIRGGATRFDPATLRSALDGSLDRLQTDYLDLYQLHWPSRSTNFFGTRDYPWVDDEQSDDIGETLAALAELVKSGRVRHIGLSNETPWGVAEFLKQSERLGLPRILSVQNPYSLLNRQYETGLAEFSHRERIGLLAYSPLAFGVLSGKYLDGAQPAGARLSAGSAYGRFARYAIGFLLATEKPFGIGPLVFGQIYGEDTHNIWLKTLMDYGWLGFASYLSLIVWTVAAGFRILLRNRPWQPYLLSAYVVFLGHIALGTVIDTDHWRHFYLLLGLIWGSIALEARHQRAQTSPAY